MAAKSGLYKPQISRDLLIGAHATLSPTAFFNGILDEVRLWNTLRTANQIENNFRSTISPSSPANTNLVAYYRFDEGTGTTAKDITVPANDGTLEGSPAWTSTSFETRPITHQPLTASRLASLIHVNASNAGISDLSGAEFLVNAQTLNLSGNRLDDADLSALLPRRLTTGPQAGEQVGLSALQSLNLTGNISITSIGQLTGFPELSSLRLEGTSVDLNSTSSTRTLSSLTKLTTLTVPSQVLTQGQNLVTLEGQPTSIPFQVGVLNFDGVDDFVTTSSASALGLNGSFTASAWSFRRVPIPS